jgi:hypothetical protein
MRHGNIEATYAELDLGRMLYAGGVDFRFVEPQLKKGFDYDVEIILPDGVSVCADAKCKIETTEFSEQTVMNSLIDARKQFPRDRPSAVFVKVPPAWFEQPHTGKSLNEIAYEFLRTTRRIVSVKYYVSTLVYSERYLRHDHGFKEISNPRNKFDPYRDWNMFADPSSVGSWNGMPPRWRRLLFFPKVGPS